MVSGFGVCVPLDIGFVLVWNGIEMRGTIGFGSMERWVSAPEEGFEGWSLWVFEKSKELLL